MASRVFGDGWQTRMTVPKVPESFTRAASAASKALQMDVGGGAGANGGEGSMSLSQPPAPSLGNANTSSLGAGGSGSESWQDEWRAALATEPSPAPELPNPMQEVETRAKMEAFNKKLRATVSQREALDAKIKELRQELHAVQENREGIVDLEVWLSRETAEMEESLSGASEGRNLDGYWSKGTIKGTSLTWSNGNSETIERIGPAKILLKLGGQSLIGDLKADGTTLQWSDGDIWTKVLRPVTPVVGDIADISEFLAGTKAGGLQPGNVALEPKQEKFGFTVDGQVRWNGNDADVPAGTVGIVVGFTEDRLVIKFPKGQWNFKASELVKGPQGAPAPEVFSPPVGRQRSKSRELSRERSLSGERQRAAAVARAPRTPRSKSREREDTPVAQSLLYVESRQQNMNKTRRPSIDPTSLLMRRPSLDPTSLLSLGPSAGSALRAPSCEKEKEWEQSIGQDTATCSVCGLKFPLDAESIDSHSRMCSKRHSNSKNAAGLDTFADLPQGSSRRAHSWSMPDEAARSRWSIRPSLPSLPGFLPGRRKTILPDGSS